MLPSLTIREDKMGDGHFGSSRYRKSNNTHYSHEGVDYIVKPGDSVYAPEDGRLVREAIPYTGFSGFLFQGKSGKQYKVFYAAPNFELIGKDVKAHTKIATAQDVSSKYPGKGMIPHIHVEVRMMDTLLDASKHITASTILHRYPYYIIGGTVALIALIIFFIIKTRK